MRAEEFRQHFPGLVDTVHLASCSQGALSDRVREAMDQFMESWQQEVAPWDQWMLMVDEARRQFARLIHANDSDVAVVSCASEAAFQVAWGQTYSDARDTIVTNDLEFPSIAHVWLAAQQRGAEVRFVQDVAGDLTVEAYQNAIDERTTLVSVPLVSYANGMRPQVRAIADYAHRYGARVVVDAYQGAGVVPSNVDDLGCDYLFAGSLKYLLGTPGMAFLWTNPRIDHPIDPVLTGWFARTAPFAFTPRVLDYAAGARRFQTGTPAIPAAYAAAAGIRLINETDRQVVFTHVASLADQLQRGAEEAGYALYSPTDPDKRGPQVAVLTPDSEGLGEFS
ncbi:aminotransferase class V-fold PLP-dependent enzyme [Sulfobacillus harzensis]|uniref:Aminotransferase class V-fold PLP-dependent enzyme n=1 Tax=Sulfobacillus harzensis TaxID=2729629 RepID=A0A7Y0L7Y4_9FIRM|nr:aminotransferase class V-fold PLP-dependent enzyme [Sulfobacillus harzensis]NMP24983.1 aminotransferase class V-fold PLP-dependent enzyme [Sulfobacillus harzensis]